MHVFSQDKIERMPLYATAHTIAKYFGVTNGCVTRWIQDSGMPALKNGDGSYLIYRNDFIEWARRNRRLQAPSDSPELPAHTSR